jgi:hypothetical protein
MSEGRRKKWYDEKFVGIREAGSCGGWITTESARSDEETVNSHLLL